MRTFNVMWLRSWKCGLLTAAVTLSGCNAVPSWQYRQSQIQSISMFHENRQLAGQVHETQRLVSQLQAENEQLQMANAQLNGSLQVANQRLDNLNNERAVLHEKYKGLLTGLQAPGSGSSLPGSVNERFRDLARRYPDFEFDPVTGVSKFTGNLLFASGSDELRPQAHALLKEFAQIMNDPSTREFKILVVGHTDDMPVVKPTTKQRHDTNWELSAHRATAVVKQLAKAGLREDRMGIAGYNKYQPAVANTDDKSRQQNRRVEIYVLAPDDALASHSKFQR